MLYLYFVARARFARSRARRNHYAIEAYRSTNNKQRQAHLARQYFGIKDTSDE